MAVTLAASLDPERLAVRLQVDGVPAGADTYTISRRSPSGNSADVRGASGAPVAIPTQIARDYEAPFELDLVYTVTVYDGSSSVGTASVTFRLEWDDCDAWLVDLARPLNSLPTTIESLRQLQFEMPAGIHRILNRRAPVLTTLPAYTPAAELVVLTDTLDERDRVRNLLGSGYPFLLRTVPEQGIGNLYLGLTSFSEERILSDGYRPQRRFSVQCVQVERPDPAVYVPVAPNTYANVRADYATYAALKTAVGTYDQLAFTFPSDPDWEAAFPPWPPDDI